MQYKLYERETRYVSELDPLTTARTPEAYVSERQGDRFIILMEDMTDYKVGSQVLGADLAQSQIAVDELAKLHAAFWNKVNHLASVPNLQAYMDSAPLTLVHGDFRMENLLYGCEPGHDPVSVIDWQGPLCARGMNDVALFLGQSTTTEVRRAYERELLARYVQGLQAWGVEDISLAAAWED